MTAKRKQSGAVHGRNGERGVSPDNPIIAALRRSLPAGGSFIFDVDRRPPDHVLDLLAVALLKDATIREIGVLVAKALLTGDQQIVSIVKDALKESNHIFRRDRERVLREKVIKIWPDLIGLDIAARKKEIEKRFNCGNKLDQHRWTRLRKALCWVELPTGRPRKPKHENVKSVS
jgi:hypothetical protein